MAETKVLERQKVSLIQPREEFYSKYLEMMNCPAVIEAGISSGNLALEEIAELHQQWSQEKGMNEFYITNKKEEFIGDISLKQAGEGKAELAICILPGYCRNGYGYEAASLVMEYGFSLLGLDKIVLSVRETNQKALKLYQKLGFKETGREGVDILMEKVKEETK